jgi:hypothetical protein
MSASKVWRIFVGKDLYHGDFPPGLDSIFWTSVANAFTSVFLEQGSNANGLLFMPSPRGKSAWITYITLLRDALDKVAGRGSFVFTDEIRTRFETEMAWKDFTGEPSKIVEEIDIISSHVPFLCPGFDIYFTSLVKTSPTALREVSNIFLCFTHHV